LQERKPLKSFVASSGPVFPQAFLGQGKRLVIADWRGGSKRVHEWDLEVPRLIRTWSNPETFTRSVFSPNERWCLTFLDVGAGKLTDMAAGAEARRDLEIEQPSGAAFRSDGKLFAVSSLRGYAKVWETDPLREIHQFRVFLRGNHSVAFSPDGKRLACGGDGSETIKLLDLEGFQELLALDGTGSVFRRCAFSPDGNAIGAWNSGGKLHLWRAPTWAEIEAVEKSAVTQAVISFVREASER
jgi:WD40 repeat protein